MLSQGVNPDVSGHHDERTALMVAASEGLVEMCQVRVAPVTDACSFLPFHQLPHL